MSKWIVVAAASLLVPGIAAQDGPTARTFCDLTNPENRCPGTPCICSEDVLTLRFGRAGGPILEIDDVEPGLRLEVDVVLETKSRAIQGWSYGVRHDGRTLTLESVTTDETDAGRLFESGFNVTRSDGITGCPSDRVDPALACSEPATGFISAFVLSFIRMVTLPVGSNSLARATYRIEAAAAEIGEEGVSIEFTEGLSRLNSPPVEINLTDNGQSVRPRTVVDGRVIVSVGQKDFHRGDADADGRLSVADAISILLFLFLAGPPPGCLDSADFDDDGRLDTTDPVLILSWLFRAGSAPAPPGPPPALCGPDAEGSGASLGCDAYPAC